MDQLFPGLSGEMPAVTVSEILTLPALAPSPADVMRPVDLITTAPSGVEGEGFPVRRAFAGVEQARLDPFIHLDQMGSVDYAPGEPKGTPWHPHRGFETVTYLIDGAFIHQDSHGGGGTIGGGDTQWMTAGSGILHIETPPEELVVSGGLFHGLQLWVNLPASKKWAPPRYQDIKSDQVVLGRSPDGGALLRVIAGQVGDHSGPGVTHTPISVVHATLNPGAELTLPWNPQYNALAYVLAGQGSAGPGHRPFQMGQLAVFGAGDAMTFRADDKQTSNLELWILGGQPIKEPVAWYGPFVMNTQAELAQAMEDFRAGRLGQIPEGAIGTGGRRA